MNRFRTPTGVAILVLVGALTGCGSKPSSNGVVIGNGRNIAVARSASSAATPAAVASVPSKLELGGNGIQWLEPPHAGDVATISADAALKAPDGAGNPISHDFGDVAPVVRLGLYTNTVAGSVDPSTKTFSRWFMGKLVWAVIYNNVPGSVMISRWQGVGPPPDGGSAADAGSLGQQPGAVVALVDAGSGRELTEITLGQAFTASQLG